MAIAVKKHAKVDIKLLLFYFVPNILSRIVDHLNENTHQKRIKLKHVERKSHIVAEPTYESLKKEQSKRLGKIL